MLRIVMVAAALACLPTALLAQNQTPPAQPGTAAAAAPAAPAVPTIPALPVAWSAAFDASALRIAVADTKGDGQDRVIALCTVDDAHSALTVFRWDGKRFVAEWRDEFEDTQRLVAAGRFILGASDAQIVVASGWYRWSGSDYVFHAFKGSHPPVGLLQRPGGGAVVLTWEQDGIGLHSLDAGGAGEEAALVAEPEDPSAVWSFGLLRSRPDYLARLAPREYAARGLLAFWTGERSQRRLNALPAAGDKGSQPYLAVADTIAPDAAKVVFRSADLPGAVMDLALGDPKGLRAPVLIALTASASTGAGRTLVAFRPVDNAPLVLETRAPAKRASPTKRTR